MKPQFSSFLLSLAALFILFSSAANSQEQPNRRVAVLQIVEHPALDATRKGVLDELTANGYIQGKNLEWIYESAQGNPALAAQIARRFVNLQPDVIIAIATTAAQAAQRATQSLSIPVVFASVTDPLAAKLVQNLQIPGQNITGASNFIAVKPQLELFKKLFPQLKHLGVIYNPGEDNSVRMVQILTEGGHELGIEVITATASRSVDVSQAARSLATKTEGLLVTNDNTALSAFSSVAKAAIQAKIPAFASDDDVLSKGALAVLGPNQYQLGRQTGKMVLSIFAGNSPSQMAIIYPEKVELHLNQDVAKAINYVFPTEFIKTANFILQSK